MEKQHREGEEVPVKDALDELFFIKMTDEESKKLLREQSLFAQTFMRENPGMIFPFWERFLLSMGIPPGFIEFMSNIEEKTGLPFVFGSVSIGVIMGLLLAGKEGRIKEYREKEDVVLGSLGIDDIIKAFNPENKEPGNENK